jgi:hypothetical protein
MVFEQAIPKSFSAGMGEWRSLTFQPSHQGSTPVNKTATLILAAAVSVMAIPAAYAYDYDVRSDWRHIQRDRAQLRADEARLRDEQRELGTADARANWALRHGRFWQAWRAKWQERREAADVHALQNEVYRDRVDLTRDRIDLRRDVRGW